jgi:DNA-binding PadR family transcriptional regulator
MAEPSFQEMAVLSLLEQFEPMTAYQLRMRIAKAPNNNLSSTPGTIYPIVARLRARGYVEAEAVANDRRNTERLRTTRAGVAALRRWVATVEDSHIYPEDPLRMKVMSFHLLTPAQRLRWLDEVAAALTAKLEELDAHLARLPGGFFEWAHANARLVTLARLDWVRHCQAQLTGKAAEHDETPPNDTGA